MDRQARRLADSLALRTLSYPRLMSESLHRVPDDLLDKFNFLGALPSNVPGAGPAPSSLPLDAQERPRSLSEPHQARGFSIFSIGR